MIVFINILKTTTFMGVIIKTPLFGVETQPFKVHNYTFQLVLDLIRTFNWCKILLFKEQIYTFVSNLKYLFRGGNLHLEMVLFLV